MTTDAISAPTAADRARRSTRALGKDSGGPWCGERSSEDMRGSYVRVHSDRVLGPEKIAADF
jgi:hypothetical protein